MPRSKPVFKLAALYIERIHDVVIRLTWPGVPPHMSKVYRNMALLESAAARPFQTAFGEEIHPGLLAKGAALFHSLITNHPFEDGNKRTAVTSLQVFLLANGVLLLTSPQDMYNLAIRTAKAGEKAIPQVEMLRVIREALADGTVALAEIQEIAAYSELYTKAKEARRDVRNHPLNRQSNG